MGGMSLLQLAFPWGKLYVSDTIKQDQDGSDLTLLKTTVWQTTNHGRLKSLISDSHFTNFKGKYFSQGNNMVPEQKQPRLPVGKINRL